ncbi:MAG: hypothetical protein AAFS12_00045 [Cyanobacteria bacterium J06632_19]
MTNTIGYHRCSTSEIVVKDTPRSFSTVEELIGSGIPSESQREYLGSENTYWWERYTVAFPDKEHCSSAMVEVRGKQVLVGCPANYISKYYSSIEEALFTAQRINNDWLQSELEEIEWINSYQW